jgi:HTH-type transcriptional regulator/antitoxin MqsA
MQAKDLCPLCGEGHLAHQRGSLLVDYKGHTSAIVSHFSVCDHCGSEQADAAQLRDNKRAMVAFKKQVDGFLTGAEVKQFASNLVLLRRRLPESLVAARSLLPSMKPMM